MARVLFLSPTPPADDRSGLAMRAGVSVDGLGQRHDVTVAVIRSVFDRGGLDWVRGHAHFVIETPYGDRRQHAASWFLSHRGQLVSEHPLPDLVRHRPPEVGQRIIEQVGSEFDVMVVMGTYLAGVAIPLLDSGLPGILDAFDDDARTYASLTVLDPAYADEVLPCEEFQRHVFPWFDRVLFASPEDAVPPFVHLPNAVRICTPLPLRPFEVPFQVLFVGNPGYPPNHDAILRIEQRILPRVAELGVEAQLLHPGPDEDVVPLYARAHVVAVPLRAGGGTRIKILEAFAHGCPVVSTPTGANGLAVTDGEHLMVTPDDDDDQAFAHMLVDLARDDQGRSALAAAAWRFVAEHHDREVVGARLCEIVTEVVRQRRQRADMA